MLCLIYVQVFITARHIYYYSYFFTSLFFFKLFYLYRIQVGLVWFCTICKEIGLQVRISTLNDASKQKRDCATFQLLYIPNVLDSFLICSFLFLRLFPWSRLTEVSFFSQRDRYRYSNTVHDIVSTMEINQPSGLFIIGGVIETHFILFYSFARKTKKYVAKNAKKSTQINKMKSWNQCKQYTHSSWITLFDHSSDSIFSNAQHTHLCLKKICCFVFFLKYWNESINLV